MFVCGKRTKVSGRKGRARLRGAVGCCATNSDYVTVGKDHVAARGRMPSLRHVDGAGYELRGVRARARGRAWGKGGEGWGGRGEASQGERMSDQ